MLISIILIQFIINICVINQKPDVIIEEKEIPIEIIKEVMVEVPKEVIVEVEVEKEPQYVYNVTSVEREMLARLLYREARGESLECQKAIISVVINRWQNGGYGDNLHDVIYAENQFSPASSLWKTTPGEEQYEAVDYVLRYGCTLPGYVTHFRADKHHSWSGYKEYTVIDGTYFGYLE